MPCMHACTSLLLLQGPNARGRDGKFGFRSVGIGRTGRSPGAPLCDGVMMMIPCGRLHPHPVCRGETVIPGIVIFVGSKWW